MQIHGARSSLTQTLDFSVHLGHFLFGLMDKDGLLDLVIVSSCICLEGETPQKIFDTIVDKVSFFLMFVFHFYKQILPAYFLSLISYFQTTDKLIQVSSKEIEISCCFQSPILPRFACTNSLS